jgi:hypothetical protein
LPCLAELIKKFASRYALADDASLLINAAAAGSRWRLRLIDSSSPRRRYPEPVDTATSGTWSRSWTGEGKRRPSGVTISDRPGPGASDRCPEASPIDPPPRRS